MIFVNDLPQSVTIDGTENERILIWKIKEKFFLLCLVDPLVPSTEYSEAIDTALDMIEQSKFSLKFYDCHIELTYLLFHGYGIVVIVHAEIKVALNN